MTPDLWLAAYVGRGRWYDGFIRWFTGYDCSHVELAWRDAGGWWGFSSSPRDGGVRVKRIDFDTPHWRLTPLCPANPGAVIAQAERMAGTARGYDWRGLALTMALAAGRHDRGRYFCSEAVACALGLPSPQRYSPGHLEELLRWQAQITQRTKGAHP
jgi:hypothetical protein